MDKKVKSIIDAYNEISSPLGSYGGRPELFDEPTQYADEL